MKLEWRKYQTRYHGMIQITLTLNDKYYYITYW